MTPWAKARFGQERPGYGSRAIPGGNDPSYSAIRLVSPASCLCPPQMSSFRLLAGCCSFSSAKHEWRPIWTDGRSLPEDADPAWFGHAIGHWEGDYTLVVESSASMTRSGLAPGVIRTPRICALPRLPADRP